MTGHRIVAAEEAGMDVFDVRIHTMRRRRSRQRPYEVRWHVGDRSKSRSFITRGLADSYRAELIRAAGRAWRSTRPPASHPPGPSPKPRR
jgi:hypothetical protein